MNKKKWIISIIIALVVFTLGIGGYLLMRDFFTKKDVPIKVDITYSDATPLLYKATDGKTNLYLLGSIHAADDSAYEFNQNILDIFDKSDALAVEFDIIAFQTNLKEQIRLTQSLMYDDGTVFKEHTDEALYTALVSFLNENKVYQDLYEVYKPIIFESLLEELMVKDAGLDSDKGIDEYFLQRAKRKKIQIFEVESAEFQYNMMADLPDLAVLNSIQDVIENYDKSVQDLKDLYAIWKEGNADKIVKLLTAETEEDADYTEEEIEAINLYNKMMLTDRNIGMTDVVEQYIKDGINVFCVVGLAHIVGDGGIIDLLQSRGYTVELVEYNS